MTRKWTEDHGEDGLRHKFDVYKPRHGERLDNGDMAYPASERLGADGEFFLVLCPECDHAAWLALQHYAEAVRYRAPRLAADIETQLARIAEAQL